MLERGSVLLIVNVINPVYLQFEGDRLLYCLLNFIGVDKSYLGQNLTEKLQTFC